MKILIILVTALVVLAVIWFDFAIDMADIRYFNSEIARSGDKEEKRYWKRQRLKYYLSKIPILSLFIKEYEEDEEDYFE